MSPVDCIICHTPIPEGESHCSTCGHAGAYPEKALPTGTELKDGEFSIGRVLGEGGFGITYKGAHKQLQRAVAIKELFPIQAVRLGTSVSVPMDQRRKFSQELDSFLQEARLIARLRSRSIVDVQDVFNENGTTYIVMEYLEGQTLEARIREAGTVPMPDVQTIALGVCEALEEVHDSNLLHRDVKPANIVLTRDGRTVLIDFGSARTFQASRTAQHTRVLTEDYAAPEQYSIQARFGPYTDIFCLGATLYHALTGKPPVRSLDRLQGDSPAVVFPAGTRGPLHTAIQEALELRVENRPQTIADFRKLLLRNSAGPPVQATHTSRRGSIQSVLQVDDRMEQPYEFQGTRYHRPRDLAVALERDWNAALDDWRKGCIRKWATRGAAGGAIERKIDSMLENPIFSLSSPSLHAGVINPRQFASEEAVQERQLFRVMAILAPGHIPAYRGACLRDAASLRAWIRKAHTDSAEARALDRCIENGILLAHPRAWGPRLHIDLQREVKICLSHCNREDPDQQLRSVNNDMIWRRIFKYLAGAESTQSIVRRAETDREAMRIKWFAGLVAATQTSKSAGCAAALEALLSVAHRKGQQKYRRKVVIWVLVALFTVLILLANLESLYFMYVDLVNSGI